MKLIIPLKLGKKKINYTVNAGTIVLKHEEDEKDPQSKATMFFISYTKKDVKDYNKRPMMCIKEACVPKIRTELLKFLNDAL